MIYHRQFIKETTFTAIAIFFVVLAILVFTQSINMLGRAADGRVAVDAVATLIGFWTLGMTPLLLVLTAYISTLTVLTRYLPQADRPLISLGILILTIGILAPLVSGKVPLPPVSQLFDLKLLVAVLTGIFVAWLAGRGIGVMQTQPNLIIGLLVGTVIGVTFFNGIPVGPLIAGGLLSLIFMNKS